jgi:hypothetical protein
LIAPSGESVFTPDGESGNGSAATGKAHANATTKAKIFFKTNLQLRWRFAAYGFSGKLFS